MLIRSRPADAGSLTLPDIHYLIPKLAEIYDLDSPWSMDRDFYLSLAGASPQFILDLGCGTGLLCDAYAARGHDVTGADPSSAMLEVARGKPNGEKIEWVQCFAQNYQSHKLFDLIVMTGHAFQVLLEDSDVLSTFSVMRKHLRPEGRAVFESRNPLIDWAEEWNYDLDFTSPSGRSVHEARRFVAMNDDRMTFELRYQFPDDSLVSTSELRFLSRNSIAERLTAQGLLIKELYGDWDGNPFEEKTSHEMIFIVQQAL